MNESQPAHFQMLHSFRFPRLALLPVLLGSLLTAATIPAARAVPPSEPPGVSPWTKLPELPLGRGGAASAWLGERFVVAGGSYWRSESKHWTDRVDAFDPATGRWESLPALPAPLSDPGYASDGKALFVVGGNAEGKPLASAWKLTGNEKTGWWWERLPDLPRPRTYGAAAVAKGSLYFFAGCDDPANLRSASRECFRLDLKNGREWRPIAALPEPARCLSASAVRDGHPVLFGGCYGNAEGKAVNLSSALRYDPGRDRWHSLPDLPHAMRAATAVSADKTRTAILGGYSGAPTDMERYGAAYGFERRLFLFDGKRYKPAAALPGTLVAASAAVRDGTVYLAGGEDRARSRTAAFYSAPLQQLIRNETTRPIWVCLGDSVTHGVGRSGVSEEETYPRTLEKSLSGTVGAPWVVNGGKGGENTRQASGRLPSLLKPLVRVDRVVIMYGLNDAALIDAGPRERTEPRIPLAEYEGNLRALVEEVRRQGAEPLLCTPNPMTRAYPHANRGLYARNRDINFALRDYVAACRRVAREEKVPLVDVFELIQKRKNWEQLLPDGIHPNAEGLALIATAVRERISR